MKTLAERGYREPDCCGNCEHMEVAGPFMRMCKYGLSEEELKVVERSHGESSDGDFSVERGLRTLSLMNKKIVMCIDGHGISEYGKCDDYERKK